MRSCLKSPKIHPKLRCHMKLDIHWEKDIIRFVSTQSTLPVLQINGESPMGINEKAAF